jgi:hypothetical protein
MEFKSDSQTIINNCNESVQLVVGIDGGSSGVTQETAEFEIAAKSSMDSSYTDVSVNNFCTFVQSKPNSYSIICGSESTNYLTMH